MVLCGVTNEVNRSFTGWAQAIRAKLNNRDLKARQLAVRLEDARPIILFDEIGRIVSA